MRVSQWWQRFVRVSEEGVTLQFTKRQAKIGGGICIGFFVVSVGLFGWGLSRQASLVQLQQQNELQQEQLKLLQGKISTLDAKIKALDQLDKEIRQMVSGSESGKMPAGGPVSGKEATKQDASKDEEEPHPARVSAAQLSAKLIRMDRQVQRQLHSLYLLKGVLQDGTGQAIQQLQQVAMQANYVGASTQMPSIWPVKGVITSPFGSRTNPIEGGQGFHEGIDIANDYGTPVMAAASGVVTFAGDAGGYGLMVEINHGNGFVTRYGHASTLLVSEGDTIVQGQPILLMGSTGRSTGSHTHYEVRVQGTPVDPMLFLPIE